MPLLFALLLSISRPDLIQIPRAEASVLTADDFRVIASADAARYGINTDHFLKVIQCESKFNQYAVGDMGEIGIVQIYPKYHPDITKEQMRNPIWSLDWMAQQFASGNAYLWSCYNALRKQSFVSD